MRYKTYHGASLGYISKDLVLCTYVPALKIKVSKSPKKSLLLDSHIGMLLTTNLETDDSLSSAVYEQKSKSNTTSMLC
jgi:hypothetical protein